MKRFMLALKCLDAQGKPAPPEKGTQTAPQPVYENNLRDLAARLKKTGAKLIWCSTTPVPEGSAGRIKDSEREDHRVAASIMKENGIFAADRHACAAAHLGGILLPKNVHFKKEGYQIPAEQVAAGTKAQLARQPGSSNPSRILEII